jgi:hypothetical protein
MGWKRFSVAHSFQRLQQGENPWVAYGDFLDDWYRSRPEDRLMLAQEAPVEARNEDEQHWAALFAATVEMLCTQEQIPVPAWVTTPHYYLQEPWYPEARTANLRHLQEETTPELFKKHNVFSGDRILERA